MSNEMPPPGGKAPKSFDPDQQSLELEMEAFAGIGINNAQIEDLCNPTAVSMIIHQRKVALTALMNANKDTQSLRDKHEGETKDIRKKLDDAMEERSELRVKIAELEQRPNYSWFDIPAGLLGGYAVNLFSDDTPVNNPQGYFCLIVALALFVGVRLKGKSPELNFKRSSNEKNIVR